MPTSIALTPRFEAFIRKQVKNGRYYLIPASDQTAGHGTTGRASFWKQQLQELLERAPRAAR